MPRVSPPAIDSHIFWLCNHSCLVANGFLMIPAGRQCSFWSSDGVLGNRPVPPPALPISPDIAPQEARSAVRLGSFGGLATSQPSACRERVCPARGCSIRKNLLEPLLRPRNHPGGVEGYCRFLLSPKHCGSIPL